MNLAILGLGRQGTLYSQIHNVLKKTYPIAITHLCDSKPPSSFEHLLQYCDNAHITNNPDEIFANPQIQSVIISTSTNMHSDFIQRAAQSGKHIFCEKPAGLSINQLEACQNAINQADVKCMIGFNRRFDPSLSRMLQMVKDGKIGKPYRMTAVVSDAEHPNIDFLKTSGGIVKDFTVHELDMANALFDSKPVSIYVTGSNFFDPRIKEEANDYDTSDIVIRFESGAVAYISHFRYQSYGYEYRYEVYGTENSIVCEPLINDSLVVKSSEGSLRSPAFSGKEYSPAFKYRFAQALENQLEAFYKYLLGRDNEYSLTGIQDAINAMKLAEAGAKSLDERRIINL